LQERKVEYLSKREDYFSKEWSKMTVRQARGNGFLRNFICSQPNAQ